MVSCVTKEIMGISCDLEAGSMESEIKPTCNKELIKINGQNVCNEMEATVAKTALTLSTTPPIDIVATDEQKPADTVVNLISPIPLEVCLFTQNSIHNAKSLPL